MSDNDHILGLLADIRAAVGDPEGKLMQDELVQHCRNIYEVAQKDPVPCFECEDGVYEPSQGYLACPKCGDKVIPGERLVRPGPPEFTYAAKRAMLRALKAAKEEETEVSTLHLLEAILQEQGAASTRLGAYNVTHKRLFEKS